MGSHQLSYLDPGLGFDPFARKIIHQSLGCTIIGAFVLLILGAVPVVITINEGNFINDSLRMDLLRDFGAWNLAPASIAAYLAIAVYFKRLAKAVESLQERRAITYSKSEFFKLIDECNTIYSQKWIGVLPVVIGILVMPWMALTFWSRDSWHYTNDQLSPAVFFNILHFGLTVYLISVVVFRVWATFLVLRKILNKTYINVQPLHPDKCGGFGVLGASSSQLNFSVFLFGIIVALGIYGNYTNFGMTFSLENVMLVLAFIFGSIILFFLPLLPGHASMKRERAEILKSINKRFNELNSYLPGKANPEAEYKKDSVAEIVELHKLHEITRGMPVFPFNIKNITQFASSALMPIAIVVLKVIIPKLIH